jgi:uncharacterized tellurite resistance protein B-like protein
MLHTLKDLFSKSEETSVFDDPEIRSKVILATGVLMLEMAGADDDFDPEEVKSCFRTLEKNYGLTDNSALTLLEEAETLRVDKEKVSEMFEFMNSTLNQDQKAMVLAMIWKIVVADQKVEKHEIRMANQIRVRLQLSEDEAEEARKLAFEGKI